MSFIGYVLSVLFILVKLQEMQIYSKEAPFKKALNELFKILVFLVKRSCLFFGGSCSYFYNFLSQNPRNLLLKSALKTTT